MRLLTDDVKIQRLALFNAIEAGNTYWARQVNEFGIAMVYEHLALGVYDATKYGAITQAISAFNADESLAAIAQSGAAGPGDMGKVMGILKPQVAGKADGGLVSGLVKAALAGGN